MTKFIAIASGKGGVGKTTTAINLGTALAGFGRDVIVIDANFTTPNISIYLGAPSVPVTLHDVLRGDEHISQAIYMHEHGLKIIPGSIALEDAKMVEHNNLGDVLLDLVGTTELVILDTSPGLHEETLSALRAADQVIIVTIPELPAITDALKTIRLIEKEGKEILGVILTRGEEDEYEVSKESVEALLEYPVLGVIPEDDNMREAHYLKHPITYSHPDSVASRSYKQVAARLLGERYVESIEKKDTLFDYIMKRLGLR